MIGSKPRFDASRLTMVHPKTQQAICESDVDIPMAKPPTGLPWALKRCGEPILAAMLLVILAPLLLLCSLAIVIESGFPVFFLQPRFGRGGESFPIFKFRTMRLSACDLSGAAQTQDADTRVTRVGKFMRSTSLDELPQLINVAWGNMSIVGPRAHPCGMRVLGELCEDIDPRYHLRHTVPVGITGWAQVNGSRGAVKSHDALFDRVSLDLDYINRWSLLLDLRIIWRTIGVVFTRDMAK